LYTDYFNSLTATFLEQEGAIEVICLDFYEKFKLGQDGDLFNFKYVTKRLSFEEFLHLEKLQDFESFIKAYEDKFIYIKKDLLAFHKDALQILNFFSENSYKNFFFF